MRYNICEIECMQIKVSRAQQSWNEHKKRQVEEKPHTKTENIVPSINMNGLDDQMHDGIN